MLQQCRNPSLGLMTKVKVGNSAGQEWSPGVTFHVPKSVGKCEGMNPTLPSELPFWELEFWWILKSLEGDEKGYKSFNWRIPYTIEFFLQLRCLKWAHMTHLGT